jgi:hypothetical protein
MRIAQLATSEALRERFSQNAVSPIRRWTPLLSATNVIDLAASLAGAATRERTPA